MGAKCIRVEPVNKYKIEYLNKKISTSNYYNDSQYMLIRHLKN